MAAPSPAAVKAWSDKIDDVAEAVREILSADPLDECARKQEREARREAAKAAAEHARLEKVKMRYEPKYYARYEQDAVIDALLKQVDEPGTKQAHAATTTRSASTTAASRELYTTADRLSVELAEKAKGTGTEAVKQLNWTTANAEYTKAIDLLRGLEDDEVPLLVALHNNRSLVRNKLGDYVGSIDDAGFVLAREPRNVKALLRRALALRRVRRPREAITDVTAVLACESGNPEAATQLAWLRRAESEFAQASEFASNSGASSDADAAGAKLRAALDAVAASLANDGEKAPLTEWVAPLRHVMRTVSSQRGASAFVVACRGVTQLVAVCDVASAQLVSEAAKTEAMYVVLIYALSALSVVWQECPCTAMEGSDTASLTRVTRSLVRLVRTAPCDASTTVALREALVRRAVECLTGLTELDGGLVSAALDTDVATVLASLWAGASSPSSSSSSSSSSAQTRCYYVLGFFEALLRYALSDESTSQTAALIVDALCQPVAPATPALSAQSPLLLVATWQAMQPSGPVPLQRQGAALALCISAATPEAVSSLSSFGCVREQLQSILFSQVVEKGLRACLVRPLPSTVFVRVTGKAAAAAGNVADARQGLLEALCALVYNALVGKTVAERRAYWDALQTSRVASGEPPTMDMLADALLSVAVVPDAPEAAPTAAMARVCGVLAKSLAATDAMQGRLSGKVESLWDWLSCVAQSVGGEGHDVTVTVSVSWEAAEHIATMLAVLRPAIRFTERHLAVVLRLIRTATCPGETAVAGLVLGTSSRADRAAVTAQVVTLGNAALLLSYLVSGDAEGGPRAQVGAAALTCGAMTATLTALRTARTCAQQLSHEAGKKEVETSPSLRKTIATWQQHTGAAVKNIAVALSKLCLLDERLKDELREMNGFETLVAVQQQM